MNITIISDFRLFYSSFFLGILLLLCYDLILIWRMMLPHPKILIAVEDLLYWFLAGSIAFFLMYRMNYGILRGFTILSIAIGMFLYYNMLSRRFLAFTNRQLRSLTKKIRLNREKRKAKNEKDKARKKEKAKRNLQPKEKKSRT